MFKLAHTSDLHLGYSSGRLVTEQGINMRMADGYLAFSKMVTDIINHDVDAVLVAGDTFHSANADTNTIAFAQNQFRRFAKARIPVYILAGNHDVTDVRTDVAISRLLHDPARKIYSFIEPYEVVKISDNIILHMISHHGFTDQGKTLLKVKPNDGFINILSTHGSVVDPLTEERLHTEASPREVVVPNDILEQGFNYTLLGHIHERGFVGSKDGGVSDSLNKKIFYNGSLIRRGYADATSKLERGWTLWEIDEYSGEFNPSFKKIAQRPQYDFEVIDASELSSTEISEKIINNLKSTQLQNNTDFNMSTAPILRQTIKDISVSKYSALDWKNIELNSKHSLNGIPIKKISSATNEIEGSTKKGYNSIADILEAYDSWTKDSEELDKVDKKFRNKVKSQARDFIKIGREITLSE